MPAGEYVIQTGNYIGSVWQASPELTPYGQGIADNYPTQIPWYLSFNVTEAGTDTLEARRNRTIVTRPLLYDVLILGAHALVPLPANSIVPNPQAFIYLNISHNETGIPWATPNRIGHFPVPAIAGIDTGGPTSASIAVAANSVVRWPEAFFLPAHSRLKLEFFVFGRADLPGFVVPLRLIFTLLGVKLVNLSAPAPQFVTMPNGAIVPVGSRLPWYSTVPIGVFKSNLRSDFQIDPGKQTIQYFPPQFCDVEIHGIYSNFINGVLPQAEKLSLKLVDVDSETAWEPSQSPTPAVFGGEHQANPVMPLTLPHILKGRHRMQLMIQNNSPDPVVGGSVTLVGVRQCEY